MAPAPEVADPCFLETSWEKKDANRIKFRFSPDFRNQAERTS